jgi:hypothetical protein
MKLVRSAMEMAMSSAVNGMQRAMQSNGARATRISKATLDETEGGGDITKDMAEMSQDPAMMKANAATIKSQDAMLGALLDIVG